MPIFRYTAYNRMGREEKGLIDSSNPTSARRTLKAKGLFVKTLQEDREKRERELFPFLTKLLYRVPRKDVGLFVRQLGTLLSAGIPLDSSLGNIVEQTENQYLKKALIEIRTDVMEGESLSDGVRKHPAVFPPVYYNLISVGEQTGTYEQALLRLADLEEANTALRNKVTTALAYPVVVMVMLGSILAFLLTAVIPQIERLYVQMDQTLPMITRIVIGASHILGTWRIIPLLGMVAIAIYIFIRWKSDISGRKKFERFLLSKPYIGIVIKKVLLARFSRNLGVMLANGVSLITALQVVSKAVDHQIFQEEIQEAIDRIKEGSRITDAFRESKVITPMVLGMLSAGEMSDRVPEMVERIADILDEDVSASIQKLSTLLEPALMVVTGGMVAVIMLAILLPMYNLAKSF